MVTQSSISLASTSSKSLDAVLGLHENPSATVCLVPLTCTTSKSNNRIHAIYRVTRASGKSVTARFNCTTKTFASISKRKCVSYNQYRNFLKAHKTPQHSRLVASYFCFAFDQRLDSYRETLFLPFSSRCLKVALYLVLLESTTTIISLYSRPYWILYNAGAVVRRILSISIATICKGPYSHSAPFLNNR